MKVVYSHFFKQLDSGNKNSFLTKMRHKFNHRINTRKAGYHLTFSLYS